MKQNIARFIIVIMTSKMQPANSFTTAGTLLNNVSHKLAIFTLDKTIHPGYRMIRQKVKYLIEKTCK